MTGAGKQEANPSQEREQAPKGCARWKIQVGACKKPSIGRHRSFLMCEEDESMLVLLISHLVWFGSCAVFLEARTPTLSILSTYDVELCL